MLVNNTIFTVSATNLQNTDAQNHYLCFQSFISLQNPKTVVFQNFYIHFTVKTANKSSNNSKNMNYNFVHIVCL